MPICPACERSYPEGATTCPEDGRTLGPDEEAPRPLLAPGTRVGDYRLDRLLGQGTFGDVYAAAHVESGQQVAIKLLLDAFCSDAQLVARFTAEARAVSRVRHPAIVEIYSFGLLEGGRHYLVMELLHGESLGQRLVREPRLSIAEACSILERVAAALDAAHSAGVVHRDLKPDNIFLARDAAGSVAPRLVDFGVAKLVDDDMGMKTATGAVIGTPRYMSPEQCRGKRVDHRADIYALGVLAQVMLTGKPPFSGETAVDLLLLHTTEPPPPMSRVCPDLPTELDAPVLAMLAKKPADRPASAGAAVAALVERARAASRDAAPRDTVRLAAPDATRPSEVATARTLVAADAPAAQASPATLVLTPPPPSPGAPRLPSPEAPSARAPLAATLLAAPTGVADAPAMVPAARPPRSPALWIAAAFALGLVGAVAVVLFGDHPASSASSVASALVAAPSLAPPRPSAAAIAAPSLAPPSPSAALVGSATAAADSAPSVDPAASALPIGKGRLPATGTARPAPSARPRTPDIGF
jgi:serine/threonine-protein kinase